jgi:single-strand DNA-binding protein
MIARSLNKVQLIGNLTRDPELVTTATNSKICHFTVATNRSWTTEAGEKKEETEFSRIIAWQKLAELCGALLVKGSKVYIEGRLSTKKFTGQDNVERVSTEIVADDMILLTPKQEAVTTTSTEAEVVA